MNILVACEESQAVTVELRKLGHLAFSCDLQPCSGGHPEWHYQGDVTVLLQEPRVSKWDMIIAFPPCTYLSNAGASRLYPQKGILNQERYIKGLAGKDFFMLFYNANCPRIAIENPVPSGIYGLPKYSQIIQPYEYGHPYKKKTCLWLKGLPQLQPTEIVTDGIVSWVSSGNNRRNEAKKGLQSVNFRDAKTKSKTFSGIVRAMAEQWT